MADIESVLLKSREGIRAFFNSIPIPTYVWRYINEDLILFDLNTSAEEFDQGNIASYLGIKAKDLYKDRPDIVEDLYTCLREKKPIFREMDNGYQAIDKLKYVSVKYGFVPPDLVLVHTEDITEKKEAEEKLKKSEYKQRERIKELVCLYGISNLAIKSNITSDEFIQGTLELIPPSMQYPEITCVEIKYGKKKYRTNNFKETTWKLSTNVNINEKNLNINVYYLEDKPFLVEESHLLNDIIHRIEIIIEKKKAEANLKKLNVELENKIEKRTNELKESQEKYRSLFDQSMVGCSIVKDDLIIDANQVLLDIFGNNSFEDFVKKSISDRVAPASKEAVMKRYRKIQNGINVDPRFELKFLRKDGKTIDVETIYSEIFIGNERHIQTIFRDITESKQREDELRLHSAIMTNISEGVYLIRLEDEIIVYTNSRFEEMFGYNPGEIIGKYVAIVNAPTDKSPEETAQDILGILIETGEWHGEVKNIKKDGTHFWCYANVSLFDHPEYGRVIVSVHTDITTQKKVEETDIGKLTL